MMASWDYEKSIGDWFRFNYISGDIELKTPVYKIVEATELAQFMNPDAKVTKSGTIWIKNNG